MTLDTLLAQITANAPECPAYKINGYLLEFLEQCKLQGTREIATIDTSGFASPRNSIQIPSDVFQVHSVYLNGREIAQDLREADIIHNDPTMGNTQVLADPYDDHIIADYGGNKIGMIT